MRLYLSSFDIGDAPTELVKLAPNGRVGIIMNALDNFPDARQSWQDAQAEKLVGLGFTVAPLDLRDHFGPASAIGERLAQLDAVWITGGNTFVLRRAMALSGFDVAIKVALENDRIVYAGFSAAAVVLHRSLRGLELVDDPNDVPEGYPPDVPWEGLDILPFSVVVHFDSEHPESVGASKEVEFYKANGIAFETLKDGQALVIANGAPFIAP
jgi:dipeptidase E